MVLVPVSRSISNRRFVASFANHDHGGPVSCSNSWEHSGIEAQSVRILQRRRWPTLEEVFLGIIYVGPPNENVGPHR